MQETKSISDWLTQTTGRHSASRPVFVTHDAELAERQGSRLLGPHRLEVRRNFAISLYEAPLASSHLLGLEYEGRPDLISTAPVDHYTITATVNGTLRVHSDGKEAVGPTGWLVITPPCEFVRISVDPSTILAGFRIPHHVLERRLSILSGRPVNNHLELERSIPPSMNAENVIAALRQAVTVVEQVRLLTPSLAQAVEESLLTSILLGIPGDHTHELYRSAEPAAGRAVREAAALIRETGPQCPPLTDVATTVGVSLRRLQAGFRATLGTTPSRYLRDIRLDAAHQALKSAHPSDATVAAIATSVGLDHLGRFSADYRRRFGVSPSVTLRAPAS